MKWTEACLGKLVVNRTKDARLHSASSMLGHMNFVENDHEIISKVLLLIQEGYLLVTGKSMCTSIG